VKANEPLIVLVKIGASHAELAADLAGYEPRARAGRLRNLALAGLLLQQQGRAGGLPTPAMPAEPAQVTDVPPALPAEPLGGDEPAAVRQRARRRLIESLGDD
jgi:hypothetical protein